MSNFQFQTHVHTLRLEAIHSENCYTATLNLVQIISMQRRGCVNGQILQWLSFIGSARIQDILKSIRMKTCMANILHSWYLELRCYQQQERVT